VQIRELSVPDAYEITPILRKDDRGVFFESYRFDRLAEMFGHSLTLRQANTSVSKKGVVRGIHYADVPLGQAKYVTCTHGAVLDFIVDLRVGSPTFGQWDSVQLDDVNFKSVYLSEGLGHAFIALTEGAVVSYLVSDIYQPEREHGIDPLDTSIGLVFPTEAGEPLLSPKDVEAPSLEEAAAAGLLPEAAAVRAFLRSLDQASD
jgi:dTDP-4-dehydrorhamnose 3,5-epimerase